eukprot:g1651.t1
MWWVQIACASMIVWYGIEQYIEPIVSRFLSRKKIMTSGTRRFYLSAVIHHLLTSVPALYVLFVESEVAATKEPERSFRCLGPVSIVSSLLPPLSLGYGVHDLIDGYRRRDVSVLIHGSLLTSGLVILLHLDVAHHIVRIFTINISSFFLNLRALDFGTRSNVAVDLMFVASFAILRAIVLPMWWIQFLSFAHRTPATTWGTCMSWGVVRGAILGGMILHSLNFYWLYRIVMRAYERYAASSVRRRGAGIISSG